MTSLTSARNLQELVKTREVILLDVSPVSNKAGLLPSYPDEMIPGSFVVSIKKELAQPGASFPNTFPESGIFDSFCKSVGIHEDTEVVVYDNLGLYSSPRVWWIFKTMGFKSISVLNGGLTAWKKSGGETVPRRIVERPNDGSFRGKKELTSVKSYQDILQNIEHKEFHVIDARSAGRFDGSTPEPRPHLQSGSIQGSSSLPFKELITNGMMKSHDELKDAFKGFGDKGELTFSCGSGMTACIALLAADQVLDMPMSVYDGSWTEWAELQELFTS